MLSKEQQKIILRIYINHVTSGTGTIDFDNIKDVYKSKTAFKRSIRYLEESKYIQPNRIAYNKVVYSLTLTGEMLARVLCNMVDLPEEVRKMKYKGIWNW